MPERVDMSKLPWATWESKFKQLLYKHIGDEIGQVYSNATRDYIHELYEGNHDPQRAFDIFILHGAPKTDIMFKY